MRFISTTYLALTQSPAVDALAAPSDGVDVTIERPAFEEYMRLWRSIGEPLDWDGRLLTSAEELATILSSSDTEIHLARVRGEAVGLCEFSMNESLGSEIVYFGLVPAFQGRRLGHYLLDIALRRHWKTNHPRHVWLHTDIWDDPRALPLYERFGFQIFAKVDMPETATEADYRAVARARLTVMTLDRGEHSE